MKHITEATDLEIASALVLSKALPRVNVGTDESPEWAEDLVAVAAALRTHFDFTPDPHPVGDVAEMIAELNHLAWLVVGTKNGEMVDLAHFTRERMEKAFKAATAALVSLSSPPTAPSDEERKAIWEAGRIAGGTHALDILAHANAGELLPESLVNPYA